MKKFIGIILGLVLIIIILAFIFRPQSNFPTPININTDNQPTMGQTNAKVHIVAFEDLKCIACKDFSNSIIPQIKKNYIDTGIAKFTMINLAFIPGSMTAANAAHCLYTQNKNFFFPFVIYTYRHQPPETTDWATIPKLVEFASHIQGVDQDKLSQCIYDSPYTKLINDNFHAAEQALGSPVMTPAVFINGIRVDPLTYPQIQKIIKHVS